MLDRIVRHRAFGWIYMPLLFVAACLVVWYNREVDGVIGFVLIASVMLVVSSRLTDAMYPVMLLAVFVTRCYDSADTFLARAWVAVPAVAAILFHFLYYRKPIRVGRSFWGLCAVAVAVTLGGVGTISASEYFAPTALFYVFGLGGGMVVFYLLARSHLDSDSAREIAKILYIVGILACLCVLRFYMEDWEWVMKKHRFARFQSSNNLATFLMLALPFPLYFAKKRYVDILAVFFMYACLFLTGSRGGILMGTVELILVLASFAVAQWKRPVNCILCSASLIAFVAVVAHFLSKTMASMEISPSLNGLEALFETITGLFVYEGESRLQLLSRVKSDFTTNPVFGVGIGYTGNADIYSPVKGAMNWYHMWTAQIVGGLGVVGILAYGYQLVERIIIFFRSRSFINLTLFLSYGGLFLMSQVNPGEFCPVPYAMLAVTYFILMEKEIAPKEIQS